MRTANRAGRWLGVKAAVERIIVFRLAVWTHFKTGHGGLWAVIGNIADDGESRSAIGAVDEWVTVASIGRVEEFAAAVRADGHIRRNGNKVTLVCFAGDDPEFRIAVDWYGRGLNIVDARKRRSVVLQLMEKVIQ